MNTDQIKAAMGEVGMRARVCSATPLVIHAEGDTASALARLEGGGWRVTAHRIGDPDSYECGATSVHQLVTDLHQYYDVHGYSLERAA